MRCCWVADWPTVGHVGGEWPSLLTPTPVPPDLCCVSGQRERRPGPALGLGPVGCPPAAEKPPQPGTPPSVRGGEQGPAPHPASFSRVYTDKLRGVPH